MSAPQRGSYVDFGEFQPACVQEQSHDSEQSKMGGYALASRDHLPAAFRDISHSLEPKGRAGRWKRNQNSEAQIFLPHHQKSQSTASARTIYPENKTSEEQHFDSATVCLPSSVTKLLSMGRQMGRPQPPPHFTEIKAQSLLFPPSPRRDGTRRGNTGCNEVSNPRL